MHRLLGAATCTTLLLVMLDVPAQASFREVKGATVVLERTSRGPASLKLAVYTLVDGAPADTARASAFTGIVGQRRGRSGFVQPFALMSVSADPAPSAYASGNRYGCPQFGCGALGSAGMVITTVELDDTGMADARSLDRIYVVTTSRQPSLQYQARGWKAVIRPLTFRFVGRSEGAASLSGGLVGPADADVFVSATLRGAARGSIAAAQLPCGTAAVGRGHLRGPARASKSVSCLGNSESSRAGLSSSSAALWTFAADAAAFGSSGSDSARLLVIDLPSSLGGR